MQGCSAEVVCAQTQPGDEVCLLGSSDILGCWESIRALRLVTDSAKFPSWWRKSLQIQAGAEFKFVIVRPDGAVTWEDLPDNRRWPANLTDGACVCARFGEPGETIRQDNAGFANGGGGGGSHVEKSGEDGQVELPLLKTRPSSLSGATGVLRQESSPDSTSPQYGRQNTGTRLRERILRMSSSDPNRRLTDVYELEARKFGEGAFGVVCACRLKGAEHSVNQVVKTVVKLDVSNTEELLKEIELTARMDHPNIVRLFDRFEDERSVYLILDACEGGELFDRIVEAGRLCEQEAAVLTRQMLNAVSYVHSTGVCHRDLKPENFLLVVKGAPIAQTHLKLIDFGLSKEFGDGQELKTPVGTSSYVAPEVLSGRYTELCDEWSLGTIVFILLSGRPPFGGRNDNQILQNVRRAKYTFDGPIWSCVSQDAKDFIRSVLVRDVQVRLTAAQCMEHPWIQNCAKLPTEPLPSGLLENIQAWSRTSRFKRTALTVVVGQVSHDQIDELKNIFVSLDTNHDGHLTLEELHEGLCQHGVDVPEGLRSILEEMDTSENKAGGICYSEFLAAAIDRRTFEREELCWHAFKAFDLDQDGHISQAEVVKVLAHDLLDYVPDAQAVREAMAEVDTDGDGQISFVEFMRMMRTGLPGPEFG